MTHYEILGAIGAGGMGEVYRARDTRLEREVAIKVLPLEFVDDEDRLRRFEREAKTLASLHHPNVASIFGIDQVGDTCFLALELVPGEDLSEVLAGGPLPLDQAFDVCRQIAEGLEAAHEAGVIHRDLKPANVRITPEGHVKVLDFGLAKPIERGASGIGKEDSFLATQEGMVLGTPTYMSPEQARARPVDRRTDIWAFGCVLFECLTGNRAFGGDAMADILGAIVGSEPDYAALPADTPAPIRSLLGRCFEKDPRKRLRDIGEARLLLEHPASFWTGEANPETAGERRTRSGLLPWALCAALALALVGFLTSRDARPQAAPPAPRVHLALALPEGASMPIDNGDQFQLLALSPDGSRVAFLMRTGTSTRLALRDLDSFEVRELPGTEKASSPFFSPDGRWVAYFLGRRLMKSAVDGGSPVEIAECDLNRGGVWAPDGTIVFTPNTNGGLLAVSGNGGPTRSLTELDEADEERSHRWPALLPGGTEVAFTVGTLRNTSDYEQSRIDAVSLETGERRTLLRGASMVRASASGELLFSRGGVVYRMPLSKANGGFPDQAEPLLSAVAGNSNSGVVYFDLARNGTLVYKQADPNAGKSELAWVARDGAIEALEFPTREYSTPRLSPDGTRVAVTVGSTGKGEADAWVGDLATGTLTRITLEGSNAPPVWSNDGTHLIYIAPSSGAEHVFRRLADGSGEPLDLFQFPDERGRFALALSSDSRTLAFQRIAESDGAVEPMLLDLVDGAVRRMSEPGSAEWWSLNLSPGGRYICYCSTDPGQWALLVREFPGLERIWQITDSGQFSRWSAAGDEILYLEDNAMMSVPVVTDPSFSYGPPRELYRADFLPRWENVANFDVARDGRLLVVRPISKSSAAGVLNVILNVLDE